MGIASNYTIRGVRGASFTKTVFLTTSGEPFDITGYTPSISFFGRLQETIGAGVDPDPDYVFDATVTVVDAPGGELSLFLSAEDLVVCDNDENLTPKYEVLLTEDANPSNVIRLLLGRVVVDD